MPLAESNSESYHRKRVKGAPRTVQILHVVAGGAFLFLGMSLMLGLFVVPISLLLGKIQVTWMDFLQCLALALRVGILFLAYTDLKQVIDAYKVLDNLRAELDTKDLNTLTNAKRELLVFYGQRED
jgi:Na+/proline symporter